MIGLGQARGKSLELSNAHTDVQNLCREWGHELNIEIRKESDITRDRLQSIQKRTPGGYARVWAMPFQNNPTTKELEKYGLREQCDSMAQISTAELRENGFEAADLDMIRCTVIDDKARYRIKEVGRTSPYLDDFLYISLALTKI